MKDQTQKKKMLLDFEQSSEFDSNLYYSLKAWKFKILITEIYI
jgi:hypothetical protein